MASRPTIVPQIRYRLLASTMPLCGCISTKTVVIAVRGIGSSSFIATPSASSAASRVLKMYSQVTPLEPAQ